MPRKTRKEKIIKSLRRRVSALEKSSDISSADIDSRPKKEQKEKSLKKPAVKAKTQTEYAIEESRTRLIKKDLMKTFFLSTVAIVLELVLYFVGKQG